MTRTMMTRRRLLQASGAAGAGLLAVPGASASASGTSYFVHPDNGTRAAVRAVRDHGGTVTHTYRNFGFIAGRIPARNVDDLRRDARVAWIERDGTVRAHHHRDGHDRGGGNGDNGDTDPDDGCDGHPAEEPSWGFTRIDAHEITGVTGDGVDVAVLDTGIYQNHCDLAANLAGGHNCTRGSPRNWDDKNGHGTHVAGIAGAAANDIGVVGVAPETSLWGVKVLGNSGMGSWSDVVCGIDWCMSTDREILTMSFGGGENTTVGNTLTQAYQAGHLLVSSAGNRGNDGDGSCDASNVSFPASHPAVIAVSALNPDDTLAGYSSVGDEIELIAPGTSIRSTYRGDSYETHSGTSMACPHVAGVAALVWQAEDLDGPGGNDDVRAILQSSAEDMLAACTAGHGLVHAARAVA